MDLEGQNKIGLSSPGNSVKCTEMGRKAGYLEEMSLLERGKLRELMPIKSKQQVEIGSGS